MCNFLEISYFCGDRVHYLGNFVFLWIQSTQYGVQVEFRREYVRIICNHVSIEPEAAGDGDGESKIC